MVFAYFLLFLMAAVLVVLAVVAIKGSIQTRGVKLPRGTQPGSKGRPTGGFVPIYDGYGTDNRPKFTVDTENGYVYKGYAFGAPVASFDPNVFDPTVNDPPQEKPVDR